VNLIQSHIKTKIKRSSVCFLILIKFVYIVYIGKKDIFSYISQIGPDDGNMDISMTDSDWV